jgi:hypothetical protein
MAGKPLRLRYGPMPPRLARASLVRVPERGRVAGHRPPEVAAAGFVAASFASSPSCCDFATVQLEMIYR